MPELTYWLHFPKEFRDLKAPLQKVFEMSPVSYSSDDSWEWLTGESKWPPAQVLAFRVIRHPQNKYEQPVIIRITFTQPTSVNDRVIVKIGKKIQLEFQTEVSFGEIKVTQGEGQKFIEEKRFSS